MIVAHSYTTITESKPQLTWVGSEYRGAFPLGIGDDEIEIAVVSSISKVPQHFTCLIQNDQYVGQMVLTSICKGNIGNILLNLDAVAGSHSLPRCSGHLRSLQLLAEILQESIWKSL